jgi:hypothetical protein
METDSISLSAEPWRNHGASGFAVTVAQCLRHGRPTLQDGEGHVSLLVNLGDRILAGLAAEVASCD